MGFANNKMPTISELVGDDEVQTLIRVDGEFVPWHKKMISSTEAHQIDLLVLSNFTEGEAA